jgi:acyl-CoA thioesterase-1
MVRLGRLALLGLALAAGICACGDGEAVALPRAPRHVGDGAASGVREIPADAPLVIFLGDSISAGLGVDPEDAFPAVVQRELAARGLAFRLVNAGVSGDTSAGGVRRLEWLLEQRPAVLVVELGGNDGLRGQPPAETEQRLREIVERAQAAGARVLLLGVELPPSLGAEHARAFGEIYPRLAEELGVAFAPSFMKPAVEGEDGMQGDGIHPTPEGHARIAAALAPAFVELLESAKAARR